MHFSVFGSLFALYQSVIMSRTLRATALRPARGNDFARESFTRVQHAPSEVRLGQRQHLNAAFGRCTGPNARLHARRNADSLPAAGRIADDAAADRLAGGELVQDRAALGVERAACP